MKEPNTTVGLLMIHERKNDKLTVRKIVSALRSILRQINAHENTAEDKGLGFLRANHEQLTVRKVVKINRKLHPNPSGKEVEAEVADVGFWFEKAHETELRERKTGGGDKRRYAREERKETGLC